MGYICGGRGVPGGGGGAGGGWAGAGEGVVQALLYFLKTWHLLFTIVVEHLGGEVQGEGGKGGGGEAVGVGAPNLGTSLG